MKISKTSFIVFATIVIPLGVAVNRYHIRPAAKSAANATTAAVHNKTKTATTVYVAFGSDSAITASDWAFCTGSGLNCSFPLAAGAVQDLTGTDYLNATLAFGEAVGCGVTKSEVNINNPAWYDILDVSLVDGYSNNVQIVATPTGGKAQQLGPPLGETGNEKVYGLFPYGCDICVERQAPPCGISTGKTGCKAGTQYDPDVICQWQGPTMGGGGLAVEVQLVK